MKRPLCDVAYCANEQCFLRERCLRAVKADCARRPVAWFTPGELWCAYILPVDGISDLDRRDLVGGDK